MPRQKKPPRLDWRKSDRTWVIRDGQTYRRTGCGAGETAAAEECLRAYIAEKWRPDTSKTQARGVLLADVIALYVEHRLPALAQKRRRAELIARGDRLNEFWGGKTVSSIIGETCREYESTSSTSPMARRDLEDLRAAVNHYRKHAGLDVAPVFTLPDKEIPRERWLTRSEAASLIWASYRAGHHHTVRFILLSLYGGSRSGVTLALQWRANTTGGWIDIEKGVIYRSAPSQRRTRKRKPPLRIPQRLRPWIARWAKKDAGLQYVVHFKGKPIVNIRKSFQLAREKAKLDESVTPHSLRHTSATWMMQAGIDPWQAAGWLGMTVKTLSDTYGHHHPDYQSAVEKAF